MLSCEVRRTEADGATTTCVAGSAGLLGTFATALSRALLSDRVCRRAVSLLAEPRWGVEAVVTAGAPLPTASGPQADAEASIASARTRAAESLWIGRHMLQADLCEHGGETHVRERAQGARDTTSNGKLITRDGPRVATTGPAR